METKARLVAHCGQLFLFKQNAETVPLSPSDAKEFLLHYTDEQYHGVSHVLSKDLFSLVSSNACTIAEVDSNGFLVVKDANFFRRILSESSIEIKQNFLTVAEYAKLHGKGTAIVRRLCMNGRISGVVQKVNGYLIPADAPYPSRANAGSNIR